MADLPVYSADGQWLYFRIARQRAPRIWRMPAQGGTPELIETLPGTALQFTPDGGTLVYVRGTDRLDATGGRWSPDAALLVHPFAGVFCGDERRRLRGDATFAPRALESCRDALSGSEGSADCHVRTRGR